MNHNQRQKIQEEALEKVKNKTRAGLGISMGVGKTLIGLKHLEDLYKKGATKFLVVAPKLSILKSWKEEAYKFNLEHLLIFITFTTYKSLHKQKRDYDCIYLDECHSLTPSHQGYLQYYTGKILGLTGTPPRSLMTTKGCLVDIYCPIVYTYFTDDAVEDKILNDYEIIVHLLELDKRMNLKVTKKTGGYFMTSEEKMYEFWNRTVGKQKFTFNTDTSRIMRMKSMMSFKTKENYTKHLLKYMGENKCIIFCNTTEQADAICENSYHSKNPKSEENLEEFKLGKISCLSCVLQINEGVNIPNLKHGIILHAYSNERKSNQRIGRLLRLSPDEKAFMHILVYKDTVDVEWTMNALADLDQSKIRYVNAVKNNS